MDSTVAIHDVRVGMFIHLDLGWMRHPFPLSSFRVSTAEQLDTLRGLGLEQVRWVPEKSLLGLAAKDDADAPAPSAPGAADSGSARTQEQALAAERENQRIVDRQYAEAALALRDTARLASAHPAQARSHAEALARALVEKLLVDGDMCIRLLSASAGDRAAAHGLNVAVIALLVGRSLGLSQAEMMDLGVGAMLHDLGKLELPTRVRHLDDGFNSREVRLYREHVAQGVMLGREMGLSPGAMAVLAQHHEHHDGSGFPRHLQGEHIEIGARVVALVDRYDNLCNPAVLSAAMTPHEAMSMLFAQQRQRYDASILNRFIRMMGVYPAGSIVQLTDERYAIVMAVNSSRPLKPRLLVHDPGVERDKVLLLDLQREPGLGIRRSLTANRLPPAALEVLAPQQRVAYFFEAVPTAAKQDDPA